MPRIFSPFTALIGTVTVFALLALRPLPLHAAPLELACLSAATGDWNAPATWTECGGGAPGRDDSVFIQNGHTVALTADAAAHDLHMSIGESSADPADDGRLLLGDFVLDLYGKLRGYTAPRGTTPGASATALAPDAISMTPGGAGRVRVVGDSRILAATGEWGAGTGAAAAQPFALEIAVNAGAVVTTQVAVRASNWTITSGTLQAGSSLYAGVSGVDTGDVVVGPAGTLISSTSLSTPVAAYPGNLRGGAFVVDGRLVLTGSGPRLNMRSVALNNVVEYSSAAMQTLLRPWTGGGISSYRHLVLAGGGPKQLFEATTVSGSLTRSGTATVWLLGANSTLAYDPGAQIVYEGTALQTGGLELTAAQTGIAGLVIANPAGVRLNRNLLVADYLTLQGELDTGSFTLSLGPQAVCAGSGEVVGTVLHPSVPGPGVYCFGNPNVQISFPPEAVLPASVTVKMTRGTAPYAGAILRSYQIDAPGLSGAAGLRLAYRAAELNGNDPARLHLWRSDGAAWVLQAATVRGTEGDTGYVERSTYTGLLPPGVSAWTLADGGAPTAVTLAGLEAAAWDGHAVLRWQTAGEVDCLGFVIRRSADPEQPGEVAAEIPAQAPGSTAGASYTWRDPQPLGADAPLRAVFYTLAIIAADPEAEPASYRVQLRPPALYLPVLQR